MTRVLLADDHPMIRSAVEMLLRDTDYELDRAGSCSEALAAIARLQPEIVLLDVQMADGSGIDVLRKLRASGDGRPVILLTAGVGDHDLIAALELGVAGVVLKNSDPAHLLECMDEVRSGGTWLDPDISARASALRAKAAAQPTLTPRERQLIGLIRKGLKNRDVAAELGVTEGTIKVYLHALFEKLGVANRTELAMRAGEFGGQ